VSGASSPLQRGQEIQVHLGSDLGPQRLRLNVGIHKESAMENEASQRTRKLSTPLHARGGGRGGGVGMRPARWVNVCCGYSLLSGWVEGLHSCLPRSYAQLLRYECLVHRSVARIQPHKEVDLMHAGLLMWRMGESRS
jgi:hypothetical protein